MITLILSIVYAIQLYFVIAFFLAKGQEIFKTKKNFLIWLFPFWWVFIVLRACTRAAQEEWSNLD